MSAYLTLLCKGIANNIGCDFQLLLTTTVCWQVPLANLSRGFPSGTNVRRCVCFTPVAL
ncbi:hypothetical protein T11_15918 [Trichinella zimbabwensis]|uniref:Uncharacterized protein n=1 Tax=Trichinella zimbabwensis TaxID=268475 RepID=A0A0V1HCT1_9BILA|nr:hypothetical protein T11_15918 [Trichinella zimbabwensis]